MRHDGGMTTDLRARLADARLYLCTGARREHGDLEPFLDAVLSNGVDIVQLREKGLEAGEELALLEVCGPVPAARGADHLERRELLARLEPLLPQLDDVHPV